MFDRYLLHLIPKFLTDYPALIIFGPRQVGKTTLIKQFLRNYKKKYFLGNGDDRDLQIILSSLSLERIKSKSGTVLKLLVFTP